MAAEMFCWFKIVPSMVTLLEGAGHL